MRILHVISSVDPRGGGPVEGIKQRGIYLQAQAHQIEVLSLDAPDATFVRDFPLPVHAVGPSISGYAYCRGLAPWLRAHAARYDHVIIHGLWQYHGACTARVLRSMGKPYHVFTHGMLDPWFKHTYKLKHLKKWAYWLLAEYNVLRHAHQVFFTSEEERLRARESFWLYKARERVVPYGTTTPPADAAAYAQKFFAAHPDLAGKHLLLYLSRVHPKKGCDLLIDAFSRIAAQQPNVHLLLAGPGDAHTLSQLQALAERLGVARRISWLGMLKGDDKWAAFHAAQAFVLPSHQENFGIAVAEALGCGRPVLISDKINIWREIDADQAGFIAPDTTAGTLSNLQRWLQLRPDEQTRMASAALRCFKTRYTVDAMAHGLINALHAT
jgi:glycosyltransferase involved in cell wall biosynthesis